MSKCIDCQNIDLQASKPHTRVGFARCKLEPLSWVFESLAHERDCDDFALAPADVTAKRAHWIAQQKNTSN